MENFGGDVSNRGFQWLDEMLKGMRITKVEDGNTIGWVLLHFDTEELVAAGRVNLKEGMAAKDLRIFLTMECGEYAGDPHSSPMALHYQHKDGGLVHMIRDHRRPEADAHAEEVAKQEALEDREKAAGQP
jgi:hypothetical protein